MKKILILANRLNYDNYARALETVGFLPEISAEYREPSFFDGLVIPGGGDADPSLYGQPDRGSGPPDRTLDLLQLAEIDAFVKAGKPVFGTWRGIQMLNIYYGGTLKQDIPGHRLGEGMHAVAFDPALPFSAKFSGVTQVNSTHHQCVDVPGDGLVIFARAEDGTPEAMYHKTDRVFAVQWHPERILDRGGDIVYAVVRDLFNGTLSLN